MKFTRVSILFCLGGLFLAGQQARSQDYGATMEKKVKSALGAREFKHYEWISYPTNNFGIMTLFVVDKQGAKPKPEDQECATFTCLKINLDSLTPKQIESVNGYADLGKGGPITLNADDKSSLSLSAVLPKILSVLNLSGDFSNATGVTTTMSLGPATVRFLVKDKALTYITSLPRDSRIGKAYSEGRLEIVVSDVMVDSMDVTLKINKTLNANLDANLSGKANQVFGDGDKLQVKVSKSGDGTYTLKITQPVIVARLIAAKPFGKARGADFHGKLAMWNDGWVPSDAISQGDSTSDKK